MSAYVATSLLNFADPASSDIFLLTVGGFRCLKAFQALAAHENRTR